MKNRDFVLLALLVISVAFLVAFSNKKSESTTEYEYVTIQQSGPLLIINEQGKETATTIMHKERKTFDGPYKAINTFEKMGYELFSNEISGSGELVYSYLLRRKKQ